MIIIGAPHVDPILIKRIPRQGIVGIAIQLIGLKRMEGCWNIKTSNYITRRNKHGKRC